MRLSCSRRIASRFGSESPEHALPPARWLAMLRTRRQTLRMAREFRVGGHAVSRDNILQLVGSSGDLYYDRLHTSDHVAQLVDADFLAPNLLNASVGRKEFAVLKDAESKMRAALDDVAPDIDLAEATDH